MRPDWPVRTRPNWDLWAIGVATAVSLRGDCRRRQVGCVILDKDHRNVGSGFNGSEPGGPSCLAGDCPRAYSHVEPGSSYDTGPGKCHALHAEQNAILDAENRSRLKGATLYCTTDPCDGCMKMIRAVGIARIVVPSSSGGVRCIWRAAWRG